MNSAFTFIGTIIGAGFTSGQEIKKYFVDFGYVGIFGIIFIMILFAFLGEKLMLMGYVAKADSYNEVIKYAVKPRFHRAIDVILCFILAATVSTMFSGAGAFLKQSLDVNYAFGALIMAAISILITMFGIKSIIKVSSFIVPILILLTCIISIYSFKGVDFKNIIIDNEITIKSICAVLVSAIVYTAYNLVIGMSVLPALGKNATSKAQIKVIALISGVTIGLLGGIVYFALLVNYNRIQSVEIPLAILANSKYNGIYSISFLIAVLTTAVGSLYGVYSRLRNHKVIFTLICVVSYAVSLLGFSVLVSKLYYAIGILGIFLLAFLIRGYEIDINAKNE